MRKLCSKRVSRFLAVEQKQQCGDDSKQSFAVLKRDKPELLLRYVTTNETQIYHFTPESKRSSSE